MNALLFKFNSIIKTICLTLLLGVFLGCNSSSVDDALELADGVERKSIDYSILGANAFGNDPRFGSIGVQYAELSSVLRIKRVRILMNWDDGVQASPTAAPNFSFYDDLIAAIPGDVEVLAVVADLPSWMQDKSNWVNGNPRETFVRDFFTKVLNRYPRVSTWQIWNEPNDPANPDNTTLAVINSAEDYVEMLALAYSQLQASGSSAKLINAATTAINQNFSGTLDYNRKMRDAGATSFISAWAIHYYGEQYENVVRPDGVADFLNGLDKPIWVTESGEQGFDQQLEYAERTWPYLQDKIDGLVRIYLYQFTEASPAGSTYGLRSLDEQNALSDLYVNLRDRP
jgi:hypothetical protein